MLPIFLIYPAVTVLFVTVFVMYGLRRLKRPKRAAGAVIRVAVDALAFTVFENDTVHGSAGWPEIRKAALIVTDKGPWKDAAFYHLDLHDGESLTLPSQAAGIDAFIERLRGLPGFDAAAFERARQSRKKDTFAVILRTKETVA
ncbi:hypothetical protein [Asticcacaulis solisilvae]|uniref:hypothetical protein n=1 Tax=Asticcacaulis solisilvae TaxID=1217274 RepID=UPI003FD8DAF0